LLAAAGHHLVVGARQSQGFGATYLPFDERIVAGFDARLLKEPLSLEAAVSAVAVAEPFDFVRHGGP